MADLVPAYSYLFFFILDGVETESEISSIQDDSSVFRVDSNHRLAF